MSIRLLQEGLFAILRVIKKYLSLLFAANDGQETIISRLKWFWQYEYRLDSVAFGCAKNSIGYHETTVL